MKETLIQGRLITQQKQPLGVRIEPADWINSFGEVESGERFVWRAVRCELRHNAVRLVKGDQHRRSGAFLASPQRLIEEHLHLPPGANVGLGVVG